MLKSEMQSLGLFMSVWGLWFLVRLHLRILASLQSLGLEATRTCSVLGHGLMGTEGSVRVCGGEAQFQQTASRYKTIRTKSWATSVVPSWSHREKDSSDLVIGFWQLLSVASDMSQKSNEALRQSLPCALLPGNNYIPPMRENLNFIPGIHFYVVFR